MAPPSTANAKEAFLAKFDVPCADTVTAREAIRSLAGQVAASERRNALHRRNHADTATLDLSLWLPQSGPDANADGWERTLADLACSLDFLGGRLGPHVQVERVGEVFVNSQTGRCSQTFRFSYYRNENKEPLGLVEAKKMHQQLRDMIPERLNGVECR